MSKSKNQDREFKEVIAEMILKTNKTEFIKINSGVMQISRKNKRNPDFLKIAMPEDIVSAYLTLNGFEKVGIAVFFDRDEFNKIINTIDTKKAEDKVTISSKEYSDLLRLAQKLNALEEAGVDNWSGYEYAIKTLKNKED